MSKSEAKKIVKKYAQKLKEVNYPFAAIYLFGSYAKGNAEKWSDIDVAVVSDKLKRNWNKNEELLWKLKSEIDPRIEPYGFTEEDFQNESEIMVDEVKRTGIKIEV